MTTTGSGGTTYSSKMPDLSRDERLAGQTVYTNGMNVTYNDQGYAVSAVNPNHPNFAHTTMSVHAQAKEDALAGKPWEAPDTSGLLDWNDGANSGSSARTAYSAGTSDGYGYKSSSGTSRGDAYAAIYAAQKAENDAAVQRAVSNLNAQKAATNRSYDDYERQAYRDRMSAERDIGQYLGARGVTGGAAESTKLGLKTAYADELRRMEQSRREALSGLDRAISDAYLTGDLNNAKAAAQAARDRAEQYAQEQRERKAEQTQREQYERAEQTRQEQYARADAQAQQSWARKLAGQLLAQGVLPDDDTLALAGITPAQAQALLPRVEPEPDYVPTFTQAQVYDAARRGLLTGRLLRDYNYYVYDDPDYGGR